MTKQRGKPAALEGLLWSKPTWPETCGSWATSVFFWLGRRVGVSRPRGPPASYAWRLQWTRTANLRY